MLVGGLHVLLLYVLEGGLMAYAMEQIAIAAPQRGHIDLVVVVTRGGMAVER